MAARTDVAYQALARELREGILRQQYAHGEQLPTEAQLVTAHGVSRQTVRRAFQDLVAEGMVYRVPGRGTFATPWDGQYLRRFESVEDLMGLSLDTELELVQPLHRRTDAAAAARLRLEDDAVTTLAFRRLHEGTSFCVTTVHLPPHVGRLVESVPELTEHGRRSRVTVIQLIDSRLDHPIAEAEQGVTVSLASAEVVDQLGCAEGQPLLRVERLYHDTAGQPVELALSEFLPEHYTHRVRLRRSRP